MPLNNVARTAIEELRGLGVTDLTPDEVVRLNDLGAAQLSAGKERDGIALTPPVRVGNVTLHPVTCAASDFLERMRERVPSGLGLSLMLVPFAMAHGRDPAFLESIITGADFLKAVTAWMRKIDVSLDELGKAVSRVTNGDSIERQESLRESLLSFCSGVQAHDPLSAHMVLDLGKRILDDIERQAAASRGGVNQNGEGGESNEDENPRNPCDRLWFKKFAAELGALTGVSPDYWYAQDRRLAVIAYRKVRERASAMASAFGRGASAKQPSAELVEAVQALRRGIAEIVESRRRRDERERQVAEAAADSDGNKE